MGKRQIALLGLLGLTGCLDDAIGPIADAAGTADTDTGMALDMPGGDCPLDIYDPNDTRGAATLIDPTTTLGATLCGPDDDVDWWTFTLSESSYVGVEVSFVKHAQDLRLELWDPANNMMIDRSEDGADIQAIHELLAPGTYEILVERRAGDPFYTLETYALSTASPPALGGGALRVFCPRFDLDGDYVDAAAQAGPREDFGVGDSVDRWEPKAMLVRVLDARGVLRLGWGPLDANGCTPPVWTPSPNDTQFVLQYALWSHFVRDSAPDTFLLVYDCEQMQACALPRPYVAWATAQGAIVQERQFIASADVGEQFREELMVYWASAFSESRVSMGMDAHIYARALGSADLGGGNFLACVDGYCPNGATCEMPNNVTPFKHCRPKTRGTRELGGHPTLDIAADAVDGAIDSGAPERKFTIAHELGHVQTLWLPGFSTMMSSANYDWCTVNSQSGSHTVDSPEWQSAALVEGFADFYATAVFNRLEDGAWYLEEDVESDTMRYQALCQTNLDLLMLKGACAQPGDATMCSDAGGSNELDWAGTLWDFTKVVGAPEIQGVLTLLSDAGQLNGWDPGSKTLDAYTNILQAASLRFPGNGADFDAAAQANGTNR